MYTLVIDFTDEDYYTGVHVKTLKGNIDVIFEFDINNSHKGTYKLSEEELLELLKGKTRMITSRSEEAILRYGESH